MKKFIISLVVCAFFAVPQIALASQPLALSNNASDSAVSANEDGLDAWDASNYEGAAKAFAKAAKLDPDNGEALFNVALCKDQLGDHGAAAMYFKEAKKRANGNSSITDAQILIDHIGNE